MKFEYSKNSLEKISADALIVFAFEGDKGVEPTSALKNIDKIFNGSITKLLTLEEFKGTVGSSFVFHTDGKVLSPRVIVVGLGKKEDFTSRELRIASSRLVKSLQHKVNSLSVSLPTPGETSLNEEIVAQTVVEGMLLGSYKFNEYMEKKKGERELEVVIIPESQVSVNSKKAIKNAELYSQATILARNLVNEQPSVATPTYLAKVAQEIAKKDKNIKVTVYDKEQCKKMGMEAFLGIARASDTPPKFIVLEYVAPKSTKKLGIIGKGITFDSGGINVKPEQFMSTMKCDMSGAAAVLGLFSVISAFKPDFSVIGVIAATPNLISGSSLVPGDVVRAMNGKTIEVLNTDAEGRVTMADSLSYALKNGATELVDLATLTGACEVALGTDIAGLFSNSRDLAEAIKSSAFEAGEEVWELPMPKHYKDLNKSEIADISNIASSRYGGAITAALFLQEFVNNKPWVHLDIAGPAFSEKEYALGTKGGTGFGVRLLLNYVRSTSIGIQKNEKKRKEERK